MAKPAGTALPGEMKQVTVLFCDIVGSTPLTERLGAEAMRDLVSSFLAASLAEVHRYGGTAPQFTGDGFMALFGAPVTQEDHVQRALLAALAVQRALTRTADTSDAGKLDLPVRIGIHTGPVVFGPIADKLPMDYTAIGDTANVAARLQQAAEPATILLSEATYELARSYARVESVDPLVLRGKPDPTPAYRLLGISQARAALRPSTATRRTTFVDRQSDLAILTNFLRQAETGHRQAIGIVGEPGIGKSRLLYEFRRHLASERVTWIEGRCVSYGTAIPYLLMLDLLRSNCAILETDTPDSMIAKVRSGLARVGIDPDQDSLVLLHLLGVKEVDTEPALANPEAVKAKTFEIFRQVSIKLSLERPLVLVLEDLHWVDKISEEFLGFLAENIGETRILMLATYRPGYRPPWIDKSYAAQVPVQPLSRDDSIDVIRSVLSAERIIELATEEIVAKADGNPLFLEQLTLHAGEAKDLRSGLMVPDTIHDVVMARIDRLPDELKQLLQMASIIGREFSLRLLSAVWSSAERLERLLRELNRLEFIYERLVGDGIVYVFRHALTQEAAYGSLLERHRRAHHGAVGHALEHLYRDRSDEVAELLALHFGRSDEAEKAVDYAIAAAEKSQRRCAYSEALSYFDDALHRLDAMPEAKPNRLRRLDAVIKQAELKLALGRHAEHIGALDDIRAMVEETDDPARLVAWHYWRGFLHSLTGGRPAVAIEHCLRAAAIASAAGFSELDGFVASCLAQAYIVAGELRAALDAAQRAVTIFETRDDFWPACRALWHLSSAANYLGNWQQSRDACRRALDYSAALKDPLLKTAGLWRAALAHIQEGEIERGLLYCDEALALQPIPYHSAAARAIRGYGLIKTGRVEAGIAELGEMVAWFETSQLAYFWSIATLWLAEGHLALGETTRARPLVKRVTETTRTIGYLHFEGLAHRLMGECLAVEEPLAAEEHVKNALDILERCCAQNDFAKTLATRAELRRLAGDFATARELLQQAKEIFVTLGTRAEATRVDMALAELDHPTRS
jgi:class 3 adenylate cyclase/tetratricopeptide (TPR) repeat protein